MFIFFAYLFSFIALILAFKLHDKYDPARYFIILWGGQVIIIYSLFHNIFLFSGYGLAYISLACLIFSFGTLTGRFLGNHISSRDYSYSLMDKRALFFLKFCLILALGNVVQGIYANGFNILQILSFNILLELNNAAAVSRYSTNVPTNLISQITLVFVYLSPLYGGYLLPVLSVRKKYWCYISILPALLISLTQAVKLGFITSVVLFGIGVLVSSYANNNTFIRFRPIIILKILLSSGMFIAFLFLSMIFRTGKFDLDMIQEISEKFMTYAFGHLSAFDLWFAQNIEKIKPTGGVKTFYGISNFLGIAERKQGIFTELTQFGRNNYRQMGTNVYTLFRFILEDFGFLGSFLLLFLTGSISGHSWLMIKKQTNILFFQTVLIAILFFVLMSFVSSVWAYTSYIVTLTFMYFLLIFSFTKTKTGKA